jgi:AcrR family transcriptional regulator
VTEPPSVRIAAELRAQIERGELAPGERVPSAREITRRWGVAIATATRVLAALRADGLVRAVPGVGTVVVAPPDPGGLGARRVARGGAPGSPRTAAGAAAGPRRPAAPVGGAGRVGATGPVGGAGARGRASAGGGAAAGGRADVGGRAGAGGRAVAGGGAGPAVDARAERSLGVGRIVGAAVAIADAEGLDGLSMRRVATELGAGPMSLYRHVTDKDDLLLRMMDAALREARLPADPPPGWRPRLEVAARSLWAAFRRHPWLAPALSLTRPQAVAGGLAYTEWVLAALADAGLTTTVAFDVHLTLFTFVRGVAVNLETEAAAAAASGLTSEEWVATHEHRLRAITLGGGFPHFERLVAQDYDLELDRLFERGLRYLLDGLAADLMSSKR